LANVAGRWVQLWRDPVAVVVDRVVAAPQDPVVRAEPVVVELVRAVADALTVAPADLGELGVGQGLGHEYVVVDGD